MLKEKTLSHLARLAGLRLDAGETEALGRDISRMLDYVGQLKDVDTDDVSFGVIAVPRESRMRLDRTGQSLSVADALSGAPDRSGDFFRVPAVVTARRSKQEKCPKS